MFTMFIIFRECLRLNFLQPSGFLRTYHYLCVFCKKRKSRRRKKRKRNRQNRRKKGGKKRKVSITQKTRERREVWGTYLATVTHSHMVTVCASRYYATFFLSFTSYIYFLAKRVMKTYSIQLRQ